jgi:hypothetical protein
LSKPVRTWSPAARCAHSEAGMTPPLTTIASAFINPPAPITVTPSIAYVAMWTPR